MGDIADTEPQAVYDSIVDRAGCSNATDTLQCLRELPFSVFNDVSNETFSSFSFQVCSKIPSLDLVSGPRLT